MAIKTINSQIEQLLEPMTVKQFIDILPGHVFIKDKDGVFIKGNLKKLNEGLDPIGKKDFEMPWKNDAEELRKNDLKVMDTKKTMVFIEKLHPKGTQELATFCVIKAPLLDKNGKVIGIIGHATEITNLNLK
jgi:two-component system, OmpR family, aerobic respiration control sensor histidine kinase ArcB